MNYIGTRFAWIARPLSAAPAGVHVQLKRIEQLLVAVKALKAERGE